MRKFDKARVVLKKVLYNVYDSQFYSGIEIISFNEDGKYTDENIGIKVLVNENTITNRDLSVPEFIDGVKIIVEYKVFKSSFSYISC